MADNRIAYGLAKKHGIDTKGMSPKEVWDALKGKGINPDNAEKIIRSEEKEKSNKLEGKFNEDAPIKRKLAFSSPSLLELHNNIENGKYYTIEELINHPGLKELDAISAKYNRKYGDTSQINTEKRIQERKKWLSQFLSMGSMVSSGKDEKGNAIYKSGGPIKKEHKAVIAIGLPAAGKSTRIANPTSEKLGAFVFDSDEIKQLIPEFKETNGAAAGSVHEESKDLLNSAFSKFLEGGERNGDNLVIPIIGDKAEKLQKNWIEKLEKAGYDVEIKFQDADPKESVNRVINRAIKTGRIIPSHIVLGYGDNPRKTFEKYKKLKNGKGVPYVRE